MGHRLAPNRGLRGALPQRSLRPTPFFPRRRKACNVHKTRMWKSIELKNWKAHRSTRLALGRLTLLVGPNGAGKSTVLQAMHAASRVVEEVDAEVFPPGYAAGLRHRGGAADPSLRVDLGDAGVSEAWFQVTVEGKGAVAEWMDLDGGRPAAMSASRLSDNRPSVRLWPLLRGAKYLRIQPGRVAAASYSDKIPPVVAANGGATAWVLASIKLDDDAAFDKIQSILKAVVPSVERIRLSPARTFLPGTAHRIDESGEPSIQEAHVIGQKIVLDFRGASGIPAELVSEGTLITLGLLTAIFAPDKPNLILIDDIDQGLHPRAQMEMMRQLRRLLDEIPTLQIVATTHSPFILDVVEPSEVRVLAQREDGSIAVKSLDQHPDASAMAGALLPGQLWSLVDEAAWVLADEAGVKDA